MFQLTGVLLGFVIPTTTWIKLGRVVTGKFDAAGSLYEGFVITI